MHARWQSQNTRSRRHVLPAHQPRAALATVFHPSLNHTRSPQELELSYVRRLRALLGAFNPPALLTGPGLLSPAEAATIFRCVGWRGCRRAQRSAAQKLPALSYPRRSPPICPASPVYVPLPRRPQVPA
jgi:hypothetical protein